ncbi:MAG: hypothetical protein JSS27_15535 [Planctomycetes bacterium]|nr:hypothetical protein [Planctomycetota bacterium]
MSDDSFESRHFSRMQELQRLVVESRLLRSRGQHVRANDTLRLACDVLLVDECDSHGRNIEFDECPLCAERLKPWSSRR